jgi:polyadenylate-binding protein 2
MEVWREKLEKMRELKRREDEMKKQSESTQSTPIGSAASPPPPSPAVPAFNPPRDDHSVFVGSVDFSVCKEELMEYFQPCGQITRCTIRTDPYTHKPTGSAFIEFAELEGVENALKFDNQLFRGRELQVRRKRTDKPKPGRRRFRRQ